MHAMHEVPAWVVWTPSVAFFLGLGACLVRLS
jgi:NADH-quinone oxidoreductase subunit L